MRTAAPLLLAVAVTACVSDDTADLSSIADQPLAGTVAGQSWTLVDGDVSTFLADDSAFVATFFDVAAGGCDAGWPDAGGVLQIEFPREVGSYPLSSHRSASLATIGDIADGVAAERGVLVISEIGDGRVRGGLRADAGDGNRVEGRFDLRLCD